MAIDRKTFKIHCPHCDKTFHVRFPLAGTDPDNATGEVTVECQYCAKEVMIRIPRKYIAGDDILRGE